MDLVDGDPHRRLHRLGPFQPLAEHGDRVPQLQNLALHLLRFLGECGSLVGLNCGQCLVHRRQFSPGTGKSQSENRDAGPTGGATMTEPKLFIPSP